MATITELKEHLEKGGKIRRPCWGKGTYIYLEDDELTEAGGLFYSNKELLLDDWVIYGELKKKFEITHKGLYMTRDGREAFVGTIANNDLYPIKGFIEGDKNITCWAKNGKNWDSENDADDIVSKKED